MTMIKTIGNKGQIELGNEYTGQDALIDQIEPGVWIIKLGQFIPHSEQWLHQENVKSKLDEAVTWAEKNPPKS
ncbi:MAG: hypothetical protein B6I31_00500 [Desulfobacteraceae bacterium 4572_19]|nr:MAG: hypothetical protein B6I31_00500 [Desulfobacteraceae bacterium 4572_19]